MIKFQPGSVLPSLQSTFFLQLELTAQSRSLSSPGRSSSSFTSLHFLLPPSSSSFTTSTRVRRRRTTRRWTTHHQWCSWINRMMSQIPICRCQHNLSHIRWVKWQIIFAKLLPWTGVILKFELVRLLQGCCSYKTSFESY